MSRSVARLACLLLIAGCLVAGFTVSAHARPQAAASGTTTPTAVATRTATHTGSASFHITVSVNAPNVQVGQHIVITTRANRSWAHGTVVSITLASPDHNITVNAPWQGGCSCFQVSIYLIPRVHAPERGTITATATVGKTSYSARTTLEIYGLQANGQPEPLPLSMHAWVYPNPMPMDDYPTVWVETLPGSTCSAAVSYSTGKTPGQFDGSLAETDGNGLTGWTWYVAKGDPTSGTATVTCDRESMHGVAAVTFHVTP